MVSVDLVVCDDDEYECELICSKVLEIFAGCNVAVNAEKCTSPVALASFLARGTKKYDLVFLDIDMPKITGIDLAKIVREKEGEHTDIIFVSNREDLVFDALKFHPFGFIRKNNFARDLREVLRSYISLRVLSQAYFVAKINNNSVTQKIKMDDIVYIESFRYNQIVHLVSGEQLEIRMTMDDLEEKLKPYSIVRIYKSYLVNLKYVQRIERDGVKVQYGKGIVLNVSRAKVQELRDVFLEYLRKHGTISFE